MPKPALPAALTATWQQVLALHDLGVEADHPFDDIVEVVRARPLGQVLALESRPPEPKPHSPQDPARTYVIHRPMMPTGSYLPVIGTWLRH